MNRISTFFYRWVSSPTCKKLKWALPGLIVLLLPATAAAAQKQPQQDSLSAYREFVSLGKWYLNMPLQFRVHLVNHTTPLVREQDNMESDILLYYGQHDFYMQAGALEQIVNDSLTVLINSEAKVIRLFPNANTLSKGMERLIPGLVPDASLQQLSQKYSIAIEENGKDEKTMTVQSRSRISGTAFCRESIAITYQSLSQQPVSYFRTERSLVPVDSSIYTQMAGDPLYAGRLVSVETKNGKLFFVMKEKTMQCSFKEVSHKEQTPPVVQQQRVVRTENGTYMPAKGFEAYIVSKEF